MSFRIEQKIFIRKENYLKFFSFLNINKAKKKYPSRTIRSVYFDNENLDMHYDGEDGIVPRKKIRIRSYNNEKNYFLEKKISSSEGRFKTSAKIKDPSKFFKRGIFDKDYGFCKPKIEVEYYRSYIELFGFNITIDRDINYSKYSQKHKSYSKKKDIDIIVEIKSNKLLNQRDLDELFPFQTIRFSKYSKGISYIFN